MVKQTFTEGLEVYYKGMHGFIQFISESYITVCVRTFEDRVRNVCLLVYPNQYKEITLVKESTK